MVGLGVEDRLVGGLGGGEVAPLEGCLGGVQARVLGLGRGLVVGARDDAAGRGLHQLVDELAGLLLGDRAGELGDQLALPDGLDGGDPPDPEPLGQGRVRVDVDLGQHPRPAALGGQPLDHR